MSLRNFLESMSDDKRKVIKTIPMKKEWQAKWENFQEANKAEEEAERKARSLKRIFWATVEEETGIYADMRINHDNSEIEIYEEK